MTKLRASASATMLYRDVPEADIAAQAAAAGFAALEFQQINGALAAAMAPRLDTAGIEVALINLDVGDLTEGGPGLSAVPGRSAEFDEALGAGIDIARLLRPTIVHLGPSRVPNGRSRGECLSALTDNIRRAIDGLAPLDVQISIEVLNMRDFPGLVLETPERAIELIDRIGSPHLRLQYDFYHGARDGRDILTDLHAMLPYIAHIQFADCPGRHEPGSGETDFAAIFALLRGLRYSGLVGAEYMPTRPVEETLGWMALLND